MAILARSANGSGQNFMRHADEDFVDLPRIAFGFNRHDYGRLRQLIDVLNRL